MGVGQGLALPRAESGLRKPSCTRLRKPATIGRGLERTLFQSGAFLQAAINGTRNLMRADPSRLRPRTWLTHRWLGLGILIAVCLPLTLWRAHLESNLWIDETYSIMLTTYPVSKLIAFTASDAHPPGYYLALKAWNKSARLLGFEAGVLWARFLNIGFWLLLTVAAWFAGRRIAGSRYGPLLAWAISGNAYAALVAREMRSYGIATVAVAVCYLGLILLARTGEDGPNERRRILALWGVYAVAASTALWAHLLSTLALATLTALWLLLFIRRQHLKRTFITGMVAAHSLAAVGFLPWLVRIQEQLAFLERSKPEWMTPPTVENLFRVFSFWFPFGRIGDPDVPEYKAIVPVGIAALILPLLVSAWAVAARRPASSSQRFLTRAGILGAGSAGIFVIALWLIHRLDLTYTFHGPRYPALAIHLWAGGLALLVIGASQRLQWKAWQATLLIVPWLVCAALGQGISARSEAESGLGFWREHLVSFFPSEGEDIYIMPSELIPFYRQTLEDFYVKKIEALPCEAREAPGATVLNVNFWSSIDRPRDHIARHLMERSLLASRVARRGFPEPQKDYTVYRLEEVDDSVLDRTCRTGLSSKLARELSHSSSKALAEEQVGSFWSFLEIGQDLRISRWATSAVTPVVFDGELAAGQYIVHLLGYRSGFPMDPIRMRIVLEQDPAILDQGVDVAGGQFHLTLPVRIDAPLRKPVILVEHATWTPAETGTSSDSRDLSFSFYAAWFE